MLRLLIILESLFIASVEATPATPANAASDCPLHLFVSSDDDEEKAARATWEARDRRKQLIAENDRISQKPDRGRNAADQKKLDANLLEIIRLKNEFKLPAVDERPSWYLRWSAERTREEAQKQLEAIGPEIGKYETEAAELDSRVEKAQAKLKAKIKQLGQLKVEGRALSKEEIDGNPLVEKAARELEALRQQRAEANNRFADLSKTRKKLGEYVARVSAKLDQSLRAGTEDVDFRTPALESDPENLEILRERTEEGVKSLREAIRQIKERQRNAPQPGDPERLKEMQSELKELELTLEALDIQDAM